MNERANAIELSGVGKRYWQLHSEAMLLRSMLPFLREKRTELWAVRGVDLTVGRGETIGLIGRNGAGKTTLLRMLAGVSQPSEGTITLRGRVAPLISVGVGFHPEMSGRENIFINAMLLGLTAKQVEERFDDIVEFAEIPGFVDTPVKFYSSGMFLRLGFSVAIHVDPDILLIDEILAVGDVAFQLKCYDRMRVLQEGGATIVVVTHSMHAIRLLCKRALVLSGGELAFDGDVEDAIGVHYRLLGAHSEDGGGYLHDRIPRGAVEILEQDLFDEVGSPTAVAHQQDQVTLRARMRFNEDVDTPQLLFVVRTDTGLLAYRAHSTLGHGDRPYRAGQTAEVEVPFRPGFGGGGTFALELVVTDRNAQDVLGRTERATMLYVPPINGIIGLADLDARLLIDGQPVDDHRSLLLDASTRELDPDEL